MVRKKKSTKALLDAYQITPIQAWLIFDRRHVFQKEKKKAIYHFFLQNQSMFIDVKFIFAVHNNFFSPDFHQIWDIKPQLENNVIMQSFSISYTSQQSLKSMFYVNTAM